MVLRCRNTTRPCRCEYGRKRTLTLRLQEVVIEVGNWYTSYSFFHFIGSRRDLNVFPILLS